MAKSIASRNPKALQVHRLPIVPGRAVVPVEFWRQCKGINSLVPLSEVPNEYARSITNLMIDPGFMVSRYGLVALDGDDTRVQAILSFSPEGGAGTLLRLRTDGVDSWNGSSWLPVVDIVLNGNPTDRFTWTGWGNELLICNGADKIISYNVLTGEVTILEESSPARHITTFNGRVVASAVTDGAFRGYRVRWSVKNDDRDWTSETTTDGIGAGFEDLLSAPGGMVDEVMGVFPLTDETAIMVREHSIWQVFTTGNVDAPFRFTLMTNELGCRARHSIVRTPFGVIFPSKENIWLVTERGPQAIGDPVRKELFVAITSYPELTGVYDPRRQEYRLAINSIVYRYKFQEQAWTKDVYPFNVRHINFISYEALGLTFDQLTGTFDELTGTFDELGIDVGDEGMYFINDSDGVALHEDPAITNDNTLTSPIEIVTGLLQAGSPLNKTGIIEAQLEYECDEAQRLFFDYSTDKGVTWTQYSYVDVVPTTGPRVTAVRKTYENHNLQIRVRSDGLGQIKLIALSLMLVEGGRVNH